MGIGHTGNPSDHEHSAHRLQLVRPDSVVRWSILLNRTLLASARIRARVSFFRTRHRPDASSSSRRDNSTHCAALLLRHADPGELFPASLLRHRCVRSRSRSYDSVFPRRHSRFVSSPIQEGRRRSHIRRGNTLPLLVLLLTALPSLLLEKEKGNGTSLKKKHTSLRPFKHD